MSAYVLDSFAAIAVHWNEPGAPRVRQLFNTSTHQFWMSVINLGEMYYRIAREEDAQSAEQALTWLARERVTYVEADRALAMAAARLKSQYALSYADCFAAAVAQRVDGAVVTGDKEFQQLERAGLVAVEWIAAPR